MSEPLFTLLATAAVAVLVWSEDAQLPDRRRATLAFCGCALAGLAF